MARSAEDVAAVTAERDGRIQKNGNAAVNGAARSEAANKSPKRDF